MNNENFAGIMGTVKQAEVTSGVCGYDTENRYAVLRVWLTSYPYNHFSTRKRGLLKRLGNWECTDHFKKGGSKPIYMHSRLIYTSYREEKKQ